MKPCAKFISIFFLFVTLCFSHRIARIENDCAQLRSVRRYALRKVLRNVDLAAVDTALNDNDLAKAKSEMDKLNELKPKLSEKYRTRIDALQKRIDAFPKQASATQK